MQIFRISAMTKGWFVGNFFPTAMHSDQVEVAVKTYEAGSLERRHRHKIATEVTLILVGRARMNDLILEAGDIVKIEPGQDTDFEALTYVTTVVVKMPSIAGDKYEC